MSKYVYYIPSDGRVLGWIDTDNFDYDFNFPQNQLLELTSQQWNDRQRYNTNWVVKDNKLIPARYVYFDKLTGKIRNWIDFSAFKYNEEFEPECLSPVTNKMWAQRDSLQCKIIKDGAFVDDATTHLQ